MLVDWLVGWLARLPQFVCVSNYGFGCARVIVCLCTLIAYFICKSGLNADFNKMLKNRVSRAASDAIEV